MNKELKKYIKNNLRQEKKKTHSIKEILLFPISMLFSLFKINSYEEDIIEEENLEYKRCLNNSDIDNYINSNKDYNNFQTTLFKFIDERGLLDCDVYNKVHIDRRLFSKIRNDNNYHPSKETILLLGFALELNEHEIEDLLDSASYSLPKNNYYDLIIRFCFIKGIYKIKDVNDLLEQYNCKMFSY